MLSKIQSPKTKIQLVSLIQKLPTNTKIDVVEVFSSADKLEVIKQFDKHLKQGHFTILMIGKK